MNECLNNKKMKRTLARFTIILSYTKKLSRAIFSLFSSEAQNSGNNNTVLHSPLNDATYEKRNCLRH